MKKLNLSYRIFLCVLLITTGFVKIYAQQFDWISSDFPDSRFLGIFEINGKYFGAISNGASYAYDPNTIYQLSLYELVLDQQGGNKFTLNKITSIPFQGNYATIELDYIEETGVWLIAQSAVLSDNKQRYRVILCDENFNVLTEQSIDTTGYPIAFYIDSYNGQTFILGSILGTPHELFYLQYQHSNPYHLPLIEIKQSEPRPMFAVTSMNIDKRNGDMLVFYYYGIAELDTNLHQNIRLCYDQIFTAYHGSVVGTDSFYFSHGLTDQDLGNGFKFLVFQKYDTLFNVLSADTLGINGLDYYPFITKSLDHKDNIFFVGGHVGPFDQLDFNKSIKKYYLSKFDSEMHQLWYKEYGGDRAYVMMGLELIEDGSCFAYGYVTDTLSGLWYAYIMHVDENGELLSSQTIPSELHSSIQIVNPGDDRLHILNPENINARIDLYDLQGCIILSGKINSTSVEISTAGLPAGLYPYLLNSDGHVIGSGKWIKSK